MEQVEAELQAEELGDGSRQARLQARAARLRAEHEAESLRELAREAMLAKEECEACAGSSTGRVLAPEPQEPGGQQERSFRDCVIEDEIRRVKQEVPRPPLVAALDKMVHLDFRPTPATALVAKLQFPLGYPQDPLIIDFPSSALHPALLARLHAAALDGARRLCPAAQVLAIYRFLASFLETNLLAPAYGDLQALRELFAAEGGRCKVASVRERSGEVSIYLQEGEYELLLKATLPQGYPEGAPTLELQQTNLPPSLAAAFLAQAAERARGLAEVPLIAQHGAGTAVGRAGAGAGPSSKAAKKAVGQTHLSRKREQALQASAEEAQQAAAEAQRRAVASFVARPSLFPAISFLLQDCLRPLASGCCPCCSKRLLPVQPQQAQRVPKGMGAEQLYCGHFYHARCLEAYLAEPPFDKGCKACGARISHPKFVTDRKALEARWIQRQARQREIADVLEFLDLDS